MRISLCLITKNEEQNIRTCIDSVKDVVDEIVVVDHYSDDETASIAKSYGAKVHQREWTNDFSEARNTAIQHATGDWIIFLDADEHFTPKSSRILRTVIQQAETKKMDVVASVLTNVEVSTGLTQNSMSHFRIFKNRRDIRYQGKIHEKIVSNRTTLKSLDATMDTQIIHTGYSQSEVQHKNKSQRNLALLLEALQAEPHNSDLLFYTSESYLLAADFKTGVEYARKAIDEDNFTLRGIREKNYLNLIACMIQLRNPRYEIMEILDAAIEKFPHFPDFRFQKAFFYRQDERLFDAIEQYNIGLEHIQESLGSQSNVAQSLDTIFLDLGKLYKSTGQLHTSVKCLVESLKSNQYNFEALQSLVKLLSSEEDDVAIFEFLKGLYPENTLKDVLYQFRAALQSYNGLLALRFFQQLDVEHQRELRFENAMLQLILDKEEKARELFTQLPSLDSNNDQAIYGLAATLLSDRPGAIDVYSKVVGADVAHVIRLYLDTVGTTYSPHDKEWFLKLWEVLIRLGKTEVALTLVPHLKKLELLLPAGQVAALEREYSAAATLYKMVLEPSNTQRTSTLSIVHLELARCYMALLKHDEARHHCAESIKLSPASYAPYELLVQLLQTVEPTRDEYLLVEEGRHRFQDSHYLKQNF